jgi:hypothetical protein
LETSLHSPLIWDAIDAQLINERNGMKTSLEPTHCVHIYLSGPIEIAKQVIREDCLREGLCVTLEPTTFIYTGGEEHGYAVGLLNYPRFPKPFTAINDRAVELATKLLEATYQMSALIVTPDTTFWITKREDSNQQEITM